MAAFDFSDFYICFPGHPRFNDTQLIEDDLIRVIIQKYEMIIFTNKGELLFEPGFGGNLEELLHETKLSAESIENDLKGQIGAYIPELADISYTLKVNFYEDPERYQDWMEIQFQIGEYEVYASVI